MPIWAYLYCGLFFFSCVFGIFDKDRLRKVYQPAGEILDCICGALVFLIGFSVVQFQISAFISMLCFSYTIAWSYHAHRHYLNYDKFKSVIHKSAFEEHEKLVRKVSKINEAALNEGSEPNDLEIIDDQYDVEQTEKEAHYFYIGTIIIVITLLVPYIYVFFKSVRLIGS